MGVRWCALTWRVGGWWVVVVEPAGPATLGGIAATGRESVPSESVPRLLQEGSTDPKRRTQLLRLKTASHV